MNASVSQPEHTADRLAEAYFQRLRGFLHASQSDPAAGTTNRAFLQEWGFDPRRLDRVPIGYFPNARLVYEGLIHDGFAAENIAASRLLADPRLPGRLVSPIRDPHGRILSFWARPPLQHGVKCLYLSTDWKQETAVVGLDVAMPEIAAGRHDLLLVEDVLDALLMQMHGLRHVGAIGSYAAEMSPPRWERLAELGIHRVTLAMDRFRSTREATIRAIENGLRARQSPAVYVLPTESLAGIRGPAEVVRSSGVEALAKLLADERIHGLEYLAFHHLAPHRTSEGWTDPVRRRILAEVTQFYASVNQRNIPQLDTFYLPPLLQELGLGWAGHPQQYEPTWLEESPGPNGEPHDEADDRAIPAEPPQRKPVRRSGTSEFCELHQCSRWNCMCWD